MAIRHRIRARPVPRARNGGRPHEIQAMTFRVNHNIPALNVLRHLNANDQNMTRNLERLSSGLKINRGADGPADLVISEQMRGQIASIDQAIRNSEASISMVQTAEATLSEVNILLVSTRQLAIHAANEGANDVRMLQADQAELNNALDTIDRIARTSQFGTRTLFDGSNGANGVAVGDGLEFLSATPETKASMADGYPVNISRAATRASMAGQRPIEISDFEQVDNNGKLKPFKITISEGGRNITFSSDNPGEAEFINNLLTRFRGQPALFDQTQVSVALREFVAQRMQQMADEAGMKVDIHLVPAGSTALAQGSAAPRDIGAFLDSLGFSGSEGAGQPIGSTALPASTVGSGKDAVLAVRHREFGRKPTFNVSATVPGLLTGEANVIEQPVAGLDVEGTIDGQIGIGKGQVLVAPPNSEANGLSVKFNSDRLVKRRVPRFISTGDGATATNPEIQELADVVLPVPGSRFMGKREDGDFIEFTWQVPADTAEDTEGFVHVDQNALAFQVGPSRGNQVRISLLDMKTGQLGRGIPNDSGFESLRQLDITNAQGALDAMLLIDDAIAKVSSVRADLGAFQKNTLQANTSSLRIANENLTAAESSLRDADMAEEISKFTRNQIMISAGVAMLAQANQTPQAVLQLLKAPSP